jgi:hypothetical protein
MKDFHPAREMIKRVRPLLPTVRHPLLTGPIIERHAGPPTWRMGELLILATVQPSFEDGSEWYHVSYSFADRTPTHEDTCLVRRAMFRPTALVVAIFPPVDEYVNLHPHCLHLWQRLTGDRLIPDLRIPDPFVLGPTI